MQRFVGFLMVFTLLSVSSVPIAAEAVAHNQPEQATHESEMHMQDDQTQHQLQSHHDSMKIKDCQQTRIECGCGCHRSVDSLPHLLSPHMTSSAEFDAGELMLRIGQAPFPTLHSFERKNPPPPPRLS